MSAEVKARIDALWPTLGLDGPSGGSKSPHAGRSGAVPAEERACDGK